MLKKFIRVNHWYGTNDLKKNTTGNKEQIQALQLQFHGTGLQARQRIGFYVSLSFKGRETTQIGNCKLNNFKPPKKLSHN